MLLIWVILTCWSSGRSMQMLIMRFRVRFPSETKCFYDLQICVSCMLYVSCVFIKKCICIYFTFFSSTEVPNILLISANTCTMDHFAATIYILCNLLIIFLSYLLIQRLVIANTNLLKFKV